MTVVRVVIETPKTVVVTPRAKNVVEVVRKGDTGKSAYQSYLDTTDDDPVLTEAQWSTAHITFGTTEKKTGVDAGYFGEMSLTDDYLYICVLAGVVGVAKWKKLPMFISQ